ncbi:hypothetical protein [Nonomuraea sp. NEAU-A123]|uniref:hypothetical protein n=1 Tax=Nonomuraea sp. NEAU-A123 TaxID=2839649 RepID=UPI001BE4DBAB|nr:hypothetical protein [Nonomuraea sp. NEAU-A123]MBT2228545.1 hypothetical protein [Nonomuraea sp. NEAU-A123]
MSTPTVITSAVVVVAALLAVLTMLVAKARRGTRLATAGYVEPIPTLSPHPSTPEPDEGDQWRLQLLEAIEAAAALDEQKSALLGALNGQGNPRPEPSSPVPFSDTDPQETAAWTPPFESFSPPSPLDSPDHVINPPKTSPFNPFAPAESDPDSEYRGRRRRSEHPATDEGAADDTPPGETGHSTP